MTSKHLRQPHYKFFSIRQFLEANRTYMITDAVTKGTVIDPYYQKLYNLISGFEEVVIDATGSILVWSEHISALEGYKEGEILGQNVNLLLPPQDRQQNTCELLLDKAGRNGTATHFGQLVKKDGTLFTGSLKLVRVKAERSVLGYVVTCRMMNA